MGCRCTKKAKRNKHTISQSANSRSPKPTSKRAFFWLQTFFKNKRVFKMYWQKRDRLEFMRGKSAKTLGALPPNPHKGLIATCGCFVVAPAVLLAHATRAVPLDPKIVKSLRVPQCWGLGASPQWGLGRSPKVLTAAFTKQYLSC